MKKQWTIDCAGTSEEDEAHLRLLLRSARKLVGEDWVWGPKSEADLLILNRHSPIDEAALRRASEPGVAAAQVIEADEPAPAGLFLRKPLHKDAFAALLNDVARSAAVAPEPPVTTSPQAQAGPTPSPGDHVAPAPAPPAVKTSEPGVDENAMRSLLYYLPKRVLGGAAQIALPDAPVLVIDPDARTFCADGTLTALEPYVREQLRFGDWKRLDEDAFDVVRKGPDARPYAYLTWLDTFIHSKGVLSRRLDPNGTYGLSKRLDLANDYPRALRISAQMSRPRTLEQIARASSVEIAEVFDVVNAYEAIGYLEWTRSGAAPPRKT